MTRLLSDIGKILLFGMADFVLSGCDDKQKEIKSANEQLSEMVFVEGGSFMMGILARQWESIYLSVLNRMINRCIR